MFLLDYQDEMDSTQWLELFHSFTAVKTLCVSPKLVPLVVAVLQEVTEDRATEVLPTLHGLFLAQQVTVDKVGKTLKQSAPPLSRLSCICWL
jgi:hypothetical protein